MDPVNHICYLTTDFLLVVPIGGRRWRMQDWWSQQELPLSSWFSNCFHFLSAVL